jgi:hypothetical protein
MNNRIDAEISPAGIDKVQQSIDAIKAELPFIIKLSDNERKALSLMDDGRRPFVEKSYELADRNPILDPGLGMIDAGKKDLNLFLSLNSIKNELQQLLEMVSDTRQLAGAEAYETSRFIYMKAQMAVKMKQPGSQSIVDELGKLFKQQPPAPPTPPTN